MESSADVQGVDILLYPVEEEERAPSPSELPMPKFGFQGMEIAGDFQPPTGRDIPNVTNDDPMEDSQDNRTGAYEEVSSSSSHTKTSEVHSDEDSDRSIQLQAKPKASGRTPKGSVGVALQDKRRRQNMLGADTSDASILYDMADQAVNLAASRAGLQTRTEPPAPRTAFSAPRTSIVWASSCKAAPSPSPPPPPPPPPPQESTGIDCAPTAPPRYAGDALLTTSGQDMHTELTLSRVVGGAVSVKLKSWQQKIIMKAAPEQDIQSNIRAVIGLCQTANVQPPPPFELRFFAYSDVSVHWRCSQHVFTCQVP